MVGMKLLTKTILPTGKNHTGTVIFFHGSGDTGHNLIEWIRIVLGRDMQFPHVKLVFPTAPLQPYTPLDGVPSNVWFDRDSISIEAKENRKSLSEIYEKVNELIQDEINDGISPQRIIVGGFSMGGALALHAGYHLNCVNQNYLAGVFACSSFLNRDSIVYDTLRQSQRNSDNLLPEILMFHGGRDSLVPSEWGQETFTNLMELCVKGTFVLMKNALHELKKEELLRLEKWIMKKLEQETNNKL